MAPNHSPPGRTCAGCLLHSPRTVVGTTIALLFLITEVARYALAILAAPAAPGAGGVVLAGLALIAAQSLPRLAPLLYRRLRSASQPEPPSEG